MEEETFVKVVESSDEKESVIGSDHDTQIEEQLETKLKNGNKQGKNKKNIEEEIFGTDSSSSEEEEEEENEDVDEEWTLETKSEPVSLSPFFQKSKNTKKHIKKLENTNTRSNSLKRKTYPLRFTLFTPRVKKPRTAYAIYSSMNQRIIKQELEEEGKNSSHTEVLKTVGIRWKQMQDSERLMYERLAEEDKQRYSRDVESICSFASEDSHSPPTSPSSSPSSHKDSSSRKDSHSLEINTTTPHQSKISEISLDHVSSNSEQKQQKQKQQQQQQDIPDILLSQIHEKTKNPLKEEEKEETKILMIRKKGFPFFERFAFPKSQWNLEGLISKIKTKLCIPDYNQIESSSNSNDIQPQNRGILKIKIINSNSSTTKTLNHPLNNNEIAKSNSEHSTPNTHVIKNNLLSKHKIEMILNLPDIIITDDEGVRLLPNESRLEISLIDL